MHRIFAFGRDRRIQRQVEWQLRASFRGRPVACAAWPAPTGGTAQPHDNMQLCSGSRARCHGQGSLAIQHLLQGWQDSVHQHRLLCELAGDFVQVLDHTLALDLAVVTLVCTRFGSGSSHHPKGRIISYVSCACAHESHTDSFFRRKETSRVRTGIVVSGGDRRAKSRPSFDASRQPKDSIKNVI